MTNGKSIIVVGAGLGGLSLAARLQHQGHSVTVLEKNDVPGGRAGSIDADGFRFDPGPTLLLMPDVLQRLFSDVGRRLEDYLDLVRLDPNYRLFFPDGSHFDFRSNREQMIELLERIEPGAGDGYDAFLRDAGYCYRTARARFVEKNFRSPGEFFTASNLAMLFRMRAHRRLFSLISSYFVDERLRQAFSFQTMYLGLSPYKSPALYTLLPWTELAEGIWYPRGGMRMIARAIERVLIEDGGGIAYNSAVQRIEVEGSRARAVTLEDGSRLEADLIVTNADLPWAMDNLLPQPRRQRRWKLTSSGFLMHLGLNRRYEHVPHHSVVFSSDYQRNFREIFDEKVVPRDPAFYICRPTATDDSLAPAGHEVLYILSPMPHMEGETDWSEAAPALRDHFLTRLESMGFDGIRDAIVTERLWTPVDFRDRLNLAEGCAFGLSHDMTQVGYLRPHNRHPKIPNLYFVGASTHPGTGVPMVLFSAELVQQRIAEDFR